MDADDTWKLCLSSGMAWILYTSIIPSPFSSVNASLARLLLNNLPHPANLAVRQHDLDTMRVEAALCEQPLYNALSQLTRALVCFSTILTRAPTFTSALFCPFIRFSYSITCIG